ncbi:cytochrome P450 [Streptomyces yaanensis]|uniref:Cytochrome P450 n=1 Tax=Streptomyces yaanensis TaxID=1142239 RepID=A0ABV7SGB0_9ACTN|nr:cytochrome P450 [Streptomyces sp. CGMCC 4.7035]WNC01002.1 cytochrome P450 [Streptomyces sp. CGMCC 4.7035]
MTETSSPPAGSEAPAYPMTRACPYQMPVGYEELRENGPLTKVTLYDGRQVWLVIGNEVGRALFPDPRLSSNVLHPGFPFLAPRIAAQTQQRAAPPLVGVDDPEHARQRRMVIPGFGIRRVSALRPEIERIANGLIDEMLDRGSPAELLSQYALPLPSAVICALLGVPYEDRGYFDERSRQVLSSSGEGAAERARKAFTEILVYLHELVAKKEKQPGDGLVDELIAHQLEEGSVDRDELALICSLLLVSGHETTSNMIALGTVTLLEHPEQLALLRQDDTLLPGAVEELMRFTSIGDVLMRVAAEDIEIAGQTIRAGDGVAMSTMLMNRDPHAWENPDTFDITRSAGRHVAFGYGIHQCIGQNLARAEMEIAFRTLFRRIPNLRVPVRSEELPLNAPYVLQGVAELPVEW